MAKNWFNRALKLPKVKHSVFNFDPNYKTSLQIGRLQPCGAPILCLPTDKFLKNDKTNYLRLFPLKFPLMHKLRIKTHDFFVPFRIIMGDQNYEKWLRHELYIPGIVFHLYGDSDRNPFVNSIFDYMGFQVDRAVHNFERSDWTLKIKNPLCILSYLSIVRNWFLDDTLEVSKGERIDFILDRFLVFMETCTNPNEFWDFNNFGYDDIFEVFNVSYTQDYFTTAKPTPQKGPEMYVLNRPLKSDTYISGTWNDVTIPNSDGVLTAQSGDNPIAINESTTIRDLWRKEMMQKFKENENLFGGNKVREILASHFGVSIPDARVQIPEYIGGSTDYVGISEVIQTSATEDGSALGSYAGKGGSVGFSKGRQYFCFEHGYYISLISVIPENGYTTGEQRDFSLQDVYDYAFPEFNNIGWQEVKNSEIFADGSENDDKAFGYQPRYSEYRHMKSMAVGDFRNSQLLSWHLDRNFASLPPLNENFIKVGDTNRIFNIGGSDPNFYPISLDVSKSIVMSRPISYEPDSLHLY